MTDSTARERSIPKIVWMLWLQGWSRAPDIVRACLQTWKHHNASWVIHTLSDSCLHEVLDVEEALSSVAGKPVQHDAMSDVIRIALLERYGGVWADATVYCLKPLDVWLPERLSSGFFAFAKPGPDRMLSSWFLAASKGNYIVEQWRRLTREYWADRNERDHYFWFHRLFEQGYRSDTQFKAMWDATPKVPADGPHYYLPYDPKLSDPATANDQLLIDKAPVPILKLTHKLRPEAYQSNSVIRTLCDRAAAAAAVQSPAGASSSDLRTGQRTLLVAWYGAFDGHGTIGDLLSMQSVVTYLVGLGHRVFHATADDIRVVGSERVHWSTALPQQFDGLICLCGPMLRHHAQTRALFEKFESSQKLGVGVSIFPADHFNHFDPFDRVLTREGKPESFEDVAIVAPANWSRGPRTAADRDVQIDVALRGPQGEYGPDACLWERTEGVVRSAAERIVAERGGRIVFIENHLRRSGLSPQEIEAQYGSCDLIMTSRFHGAMLALRHLVPFIAIDQIVGSAKVDELVGAIGWPHVYRAETADVQSIMRSARLLLSGKLDQALHDAQHRAVQRANFTLAHLAEWVRKLGLRSTVALSARNTST